MSLLEMANLVSSRKHSRLNKQNSSFLSSTLEPNLEICLLSNNIMDYHIVSQGKTTIPGLDDGEEGQLTDVRH
jgi:myosin heavy chain 6/7